MTTFKKDYRLKFVSCFLLVFLILNTTVYGITLSKDTSLRAPLLSSSTETKQRVKQVVATNATTFSIEELKAIESFKSKPRLLKIACGVQHYEWGLFDFIPNLLGIENTENKPYAEYWIGAHFLNPSTTTVGEHKIEFHELIRGAPKEILGERIAKKFLLELPYLLKVFAVRNMTSLHVHPNEKQAKKGYEKEETFGIKATASDRNYKDSHHRPEAFIAVTDVYRLVGFRPLEEIADILEDIEEFRDIMPNFRQILTKENTLETIGGFPLLGRAHKRALLKQLYYKIINLSQSEVDRILGPLIERLKKQEKIKPFTKDQREYWILAADKQHHKESGDINNGIFFIYLLNFIHLRPNGGILYIEPGEPHVHLEGVSIECAPNTDVIVRAAFTEKHKDISDFSKILTFNYEKPIILQPEDLSPTETVYISAEEFILSSITVTPERPHINTPIHSADTFLVWEGEIAIKSKRDTLKLKKGEVGFVSAVFGEYKIEGNGILWKTSVPLDEKELAFAQINQDDTKLPKKILFIDWDGTVVDSISVLLKAFTDFCHHLIDEYATGRLEVQRKRDIVDEARKFYLLNSSVSARSSREYFCQLLAKEGIVVDLTEEKLEELHKQKRDEALKQTSVRARDGMLEFIIDFVGNDEAGDRKIIIVSHASYSRILEDAKKLGISKYLYKIYGQNMPDGTKSINKASIMRKELKDLKVSRKEAVIMGDSNTDMRAGTLTGLYSIGFVDSLRGEDFLVKQGADVLIWNARGSYGDLFRLIKQKPRKPYRQILDERTEEELEDLIKIAVSEARSLYAYPNCGTEVFKEISLLKLVPETAQNIPEKLVQLIKEDLYGELENGNWCITKQPSPIRHAADLLAEKLSADLNVPLVQLKKLRHPRDYANLSTDRERAETIAGSIGLDYNYPVNGRNVILIDDIMNSGNVLKEMCRVLYRGGAETIRIYVILRKEGEELLDEVAINEFALKEELPMILGMINSEVPLTTTLFKAILRIYVNDSTRFKVVQDGLDEKGKKHIIKMATVYKKAGISTGVFSQLDDLVKVLASGQNIHTRTILKSFRFHSANL